MPKPKSIAQEAYEAFTKANPGWTKWDDLSPYAKEKQEEYALAVARAVKRRGRKVEK